MNNERGGHEAPLHRRRARGSHGLQRPACDLASQRRHAHRERKAEQEHPGTGCVLIADDQALVRGGLGMILSAQPDLEIVGEAEDGALAVSLASELAPDVVLMDVRMPVMDGLEATRRILADPAVITKVVMLTTFDLDEYVYAAPVAGASGFLLKETRPEVLADGVRTVPGGDALLAPGVLRRLVDQHAKASPSVDAERPSPLTDREVEVLRLIGRGSSNTEISQALWVAETTVKTHVTRIFRKLEVRDRAQAVVLAYETGLVKAGDPG